MKGSLTWRLAGLVVPAMLFVTSGALAAASGPTPRGHYVGKTSQKLSINVRVSATAAEFQGGRILLLLHGARSCAGRAYFDVSPTPPPAVTISHTGRVSFKSSFVATPGPGFPFSGKGTVHIQAQFSNHGKVLTGSAMERLFNRYGSCTSGLVAFKATLI